jgi:hypothetical protein
MRSINSGGLAFREELACDLAIYLDGTDERYPSVLEALEGLFSTLVMQVYEALREDEIPSNEPQHMQYSMPFHASFATLAGAILEGAMCIAGLPSRLIAEYPEAYEKMKNLILAQIWLWFAEETEKATNQQKHDPPLTWSGQRERYRDTEGISWDCTTTCRGTQRKISHNAVSSSSSVLSASSSSSSSSSSS